MPKNRKSTKEAKKQAVLTPKEKRSARKSKKNTKDFTTPSSAR